MNIGLQIVIQLILGIIGVNLIKKFPSGITKDMNNELDGYDPLRLEAKNSKMTDNNHHLDNPDVVNGTNTSIDKKNAATGRKGIFTPLKTLGQNVANSGVGKVSKVAVGAAMVAGGAGMAVAAVGAKAAATGIKAADRKLGASRAIKGFAKPIIKKMKFKATSVAGLAKAKLEEEKWALAGQANRVKDFVGNTISDDTKRKIKGAMNAGKFYRTLAVEKTKHYALQAKDKAETAYLYGLEAKDFIKDKAETAYLYGLEAKDMLKATMGFGVASLGVKTIADSVKGSRGNDFKITGVSTDPLINNYTGVRGQIGNAQQSIINLSNARNMRYHMDKPLKEILTELEESKKTKNQELSEKINNELEDMFINEDSEKYKKMQTQMQKVFKEIFNEDSEEYQKMQAQMQKTFKEIFNDSISKAIKESIQTTMHVNNGKDRIDQKQQETLPKHEIRYAEPVEKINPSKIGINNVNTTSTDRENSTRPITVENPDTARRQQPTLVRTEENEQVPAKVAVSKQTTRRKSKVEAELKAQTTVDDRNVKDNIDNATVVSPDEPLREYGRRKSTRQASTTKSRVKKSEVITFNRGNNESINNSNEGDKVIPFDKKRSTRKKNGQGKSA